MTEKTPAPKPEKTPPPKPEGKVSPKPTVRDMVPGSTRAGYHTR